MKFIDIGANLTDDMFQGTYHGKQAHPPDLSTVLERAKAANVERMMITAGTLEEAGAALAIANEHDPSSGTLFTTVGVHPTRCNAFEESGDAGGYLEALGKIVTEHSIHKGGRVCAIGECGLDYDRLHFCPKETQIKYFERQFDLAEASGLPMFLHMREAAEDFMDIVERNKDRFTAGVVHSFTGTAEDLERILAVDKLYVGINGCSLKTEENLQVMAQLPLDRMMIETDAPWCEIRPSHAGFKHVATKWECKKKEKHEPAFCVKARAEPCHIAQVLEVVAGHRADQDVAHVADLLYQNTKKVFFPQG